MPRAADRFDRSTFRGVLSSSLPALIQWTGIAVCATVWALAATNSSAEPLTKPSGTPVPTCLESSIAGEVGASVRPLGVQKRLFLKRGRVSLSGHGGLFAGDLVSTSYVYGGALRFFATEDLGVEVRFDVTPIALDLDAPLAEFFRDDLFESGTGYLGLANLTWSPIHAKMKIAGSIVHSDVMLTGGAGRMFGHDSVQGIAFDVGLSLELLANHWVTFRVDLRDVAMIQEAVAEARFTNNIMATGAISLWFPLVP